VAGLLAASLGLCLSRPDPAFGNGAFPDSLQILLPADRPDQIGLATNFGIIISDDAGKTWSWVCEGDLGDPLYLAYLYQVGPSPIDRLLAVTPDNIVSSVDNACTWQKAGGAIETALPSDVFPDPVDPEHIYAIATPLGVNGVPTVYESRDGGRTLSTRLYEATITGGLTGVEISRSAPRTLYVASYATTKAATVTTYHPKLSHSTDDGATWTTVDLDPAAGATSAKIIAVDPDNAQRVFLRILGAVERLGITEDGGKTVRTPVEIAGTMGGFVRLPGGVLLVGGTMPAAVGEVAKGAVYRSVDGGSTFTAWENPPRVRGLGQRAGKLYVAGDNFVDGFALAEISEDGKTVKPLMRFEDVASIKGCVRAQCVNDCLKRAQLGLFAASVCSVGTDGGAGGAGGSGGSGPPKKTGCGCHTADGGPDRFGWLLLLGAVVVFRRSRR
jgi:MYXO-CTERM domain-containing protein